MNLNYLSKITDRRGKRVGRGIGSGKGGHTVGRGVKGQKSRSGYHKRAMFEGGQNPLAMRIPHSKGFKKHIKKNIEIVYLFTLECFNAGDTVNVDELFKRGLIRGTGSPKILNKGNISKSLNIENISVSEGVKEKIESMGGSVKWTI